MRSTMQDVPLTVGWIIRHGSTVHGRTGEVVTATGDGVRRASYAQTGARAARLAHALADLGVTEGDRVGTMLWNNAEHLEAYLAVPGMGAVLHTINVRLFAEHLLGTVEHAQDRVVIVDASLLPMVGELIPRMSTVRHVVVAGKADDASLSGLAGAEREVHRYEELLAGRPDAYPWPDLDERAAAGLCYTSATTGSPKGVVYSHRSIVLHSMGIGLGDALAIGPADRTTAIVPMFHVMGWGLPHAAYLLGASLVMPDRFLQPEPLARLLHDERVTLAGAVPTIWQGVLSFLDEHPEVDLSSLRDVIVGGASCPRSLMEGFERHGVRILHAWGMTETSPVGTVALPPPDSTGEERWRYRLTQGRLVSFVDARIVRADGSPAPWDGETVGELEVRGPWIAGSYFGEGADDPERFDDGWLRTGDVGHIDADGYVTLTDRVKDVIKSGGEWISSVELENQLMAHPKVAEASVVAVPDQTWGERPLASVVVREGASVDAAELREFLAGKIAHWQVPERWTFVEEIPKTSVGKFNKRELRDRYAGGELSIQSPADRGTSHADHGETAPEK